MPFYFATTQNLVGCLFHNAFLLFLTSVRLLADLVVVPVPMLRHGHIHTKMFASDMDALLAQQC